MRTDGCPRRARWRTFLMIILPGLLLAPPLLLPLPHAAQPLNSQCKGGEIGPCPTPTPAPKPILRRQPPGQTGAGGAAKKSTRLKRHSRGEAIARERARAEEERRRREEAEAEAAQARAAQARAEQKSREKKDVWLVAIIRNHTSGPIPYQILLNGSWKEFTISPNYQRVHSVLNDNMIIRYDYKYEPGSQEKRYRLKATPVVGHEPTKSEKEKAKVSQFEVDANGNIELYDLP